MATVNLSDISVSISRQVGHYFAVATNNRTDLFSLFPKKEPSDADREQWWVGDSQPEANEVVENGTFGAPQKGTKRQAYLGGGLVQSSLEITGHVRDALRKKQPDEVSNWVHEQQMMHVGALIRKINTLLVGGLSSGGFAGLEIAIDDSGSYANIDRGTITEFAAAISDNGGTPRALTQALVDGLDYEIRIENEGDYNIILCASNIADDYEDLATSRRRPEVVLQASGSSFQVATGAGNTKFGGRGLSYKNVPIIDVPGYADDRMDFLWLDPMGTNFRIVVFREVETSPIRRVNDNDVIDYTYRAQLVNRNPRRYSASLRDIGA